MLGILAEFWLLGGSVAAHPCTRPAPGPFLSNRGGWFVYARNWFIMAAMKPRGRFAPTPSGPLHWGNLRSSLLAWLQIRLLGGQMVLRIEDVDSSRSRARWIDEILADLSWLGLDWDEGPDCGGAHGPYLQSQRLEMYRAALEDLRTYRCVCTRAQLAQDRRRSGLDRYLGRCRNETHPAAVPHAVRWQVPATEITFCDQGYGEIRSQVDQTLGDPVLWTKHGDPSYTLAVVCDDAKMGITHVCRGQDLLFETPRQILLGQAMQAPPIDYFHVPLVLGPDGRKLSKREGAPDLREMRARGCAPEEIIALLAQNCGLISSNQRRISAKNLLADLDLGALYGVSSALSAP